jgi:hypothetical protein
MDTTYWHKQEPTKPLYPDMIWNKPETKLHAGNLLIIGGNVHGFSAPALVYHTAQKAGAGMIQVLLPNALQKVVGNHFDNCEFAASTPSGSFAKASLAAWLDMARGSDATIIAGDIGKNSETAAVLESFLEKNTLPTTITKDALDYLTQIPQQIVTRSNTLIVLNIAQLQKMCTILHWPKAVTYDMGQLSIASLLHTLTLRFPCHILLRHQDVLFAASNGIVSSTPQKPAEKWRTETATKATVWWLQNQQQPLQALTCAAL